MRSGVPAASEVLRAARRALEGHKRARVTGEFCWYSNDEVWGFPIEATISTTASAPLPEKVSLWITVEDRYPWGSVKIYPAKKGGFAGTFPHQDYNGEGDDKLPWRSGDLCVQAAGFTLGRSGGNPDPKGQPERLLWYVDRAIEWLDRATRGTLVQEGDPFELPQWRASNLVVGFTEDESAYAAWTANTVQSGTAELVPLGTSFAVRRFLDLRRREVYKPPWGKAITDHQSPVNAAWIRLGELPLVPPYAAPMTWGEFFQVCRAQDIDIDKVFMPALTSLRGGPKRLLLVGFPVPKTVGTAPCQMHWQPMELPELSSKPQNGFRATEESRRKRDLVIGFSPHRRIQWVTGRNWAEQELSTRGQLGAALRGKRVLLIGAGALGSVVAELLVRGGVRDIVIVDGDILSAGNLIRHTLSLSELGRYKARALADRLNLLSPHAWITGVAATFPHLDDETMAKARSAELVLDCSASDDVLAALETTAFNPETEFVSLSLNRGAKRLYRFVARGASFPAQAFHDSMAPWLRDDQETNKGQDLPWEGTGCWHPVFPASAHDVYGLAATAIRQLDTTMPIQAAGLSVLRQTDTSTALPSRTAAHV